MKPPRLRASARALFLLPLLIVLTAVWCGTASQAAVLITVDVSNPFAVTFTATGNFPLISGNVPSGNGVTLFNFYTADTSTDVSISGTLKANGMSQPYGNAAGWDFWNGDYIGPDLNIYRLPDITQDFQTGAAAFTGASSGDFSALSAILPSIGSSGNISIGFSPPSQIIGTYEVVPEPSTALLAALGVGALFLARRRRGAKEGRQP